MNYAVATYPLSQSGAPSGTGAQDAALVYDATKAWTTADANQNGQPDGYDFLRATPTDSVAAQARAEAITAHGSFGCSAQVASRLSTFAFTNPVTLGLAFSYHCAARA